MPVLLELNTISEYAAEKRFHGAYHSTCRMYRELKEHANGEVPERAIRCRRPGESDRIKEYREEIYESMTKSPISKVISSLSKIRRSPDWNIRFDLPSPPIIKIGEELETYITTNYPNDFGSLTNWIFGVCLKKYLIDANAVIVIEPIKWEIPTTEYRKPFPIIYDSPRVLDFVYDSHVVLLSEKTCYYDVRDERGNFINRQNDGKIIIVIDDTNFYTYNQIDRNKNFTLVETHPHNLGFLPAFKMPGIFFEMCDDTVIRESRISCMLPDLNEAARIYSDEQAEIVQHVHSDRWELMNTRCTHCQGTGRLLIDENPCDCHKCKGAGYIPTSPYTVRVITPPELGQDAMPMPPAGYIQKTDVAEMCILLDNQVKSHIYGALASVNMQNLEQVPLSQSGTAKEWDRDEQSNFVHAVAEDLVYVMDKVIFITNEYRTNILIADAANRKLLLPIIPVPERFDLFSINTLATEVANAKQQNLNPFIVATLEAEYASKKFYNRQDIAQRVALMYKLDPLPGLTDDEKIMRLQNNGIAQIDYVISSNLAPFIERAVTENKNYPDLDLQAQYEILRTYALEKEQEITAAGRITTAVNSAEQTVNPLDDNNIPA